jgi:hypothetical protein
MLDRECIWPRPLPPDKKDVRAPWMNAVLVRCVEDGVRDVPHNVAMFANGKITIKLERNA